MHGVILGTAAYMSPEQARGKAVDKRTDLWAFGCVLYELLTGKQTFHGEDVTDILAAVVRADPDWNRLPATTPPAIRNLLRRCLQKDAKKRLRDAGDTRIEIEEALSGAAVAEAVAPASAAQQQRPFRLDCSRRAPARAGCIVLRTFPRDATRTKKYSLSNASAGKNNLRWVQAVARRSSDHVHGAGFLGQVHALGPFVGYARRAVPRRYRWRDIPFLVAGQHADCVLRPGEA